MGGFLKGLVSAPCPLESNELCHAASLHPNVFTLDGVSVLVYMMTGLGHSLPASGTLALLLHVVLPYHILLGIVMVHDLNISIAK